MSNQVKSLCFHPVGTEWCQTGAPLLISVPSWWGSSRHWPVLPVRQLLPYLRRLSVCRHDLPHSSSQRLLLPLYFGHTFASVCFYSRSILSSCVSLFINGNFVLLICPFPSSTLCTEEVVTFLNTQMLFWACSTSKPEGYRGNPIDCFSTHHFFVCALHTHTHTQAHFIYVLFVLVPVIWWIQHTSYRND